jgi:hypothetical protein
MHNLHEALWVTVGAPAAADEGGKPLLAVCQTSTSASSGTSNSRPSTSSGTSASRRAAGSCMVLQEGCRSVKQHYRHHPLQPQQLQLLLPLEPRVSAGIHQLLCCLCRYRQCTTWLQGQGVPWT